MSGGFIKKNSREREQAFLALGCWLGRGLGRGSRLGLLGGPGRALHRGGPGMLGSEPGGALALEGDDVVADEVRVVVEGAGAAWAGLAMVAQAAVGGLEVDAVAEHGTEAVGAVGAAPGDRGAAGRAHCGVRIA